MTDGQDKLSAIVNQRLSGIRDVLPDELGPCAAESFLIAGHVAGHRSRLRVADSPLGFCADAKGTTE